MNPHQQITIDFGRRYGGKSYCPFGQYCLSAGTCDKVLDTQIISEANAQSVPVVSFVAPPKECFKKR